MYKEKVSEHSETLRLSIKSAEARNIHLYSKSSQITNSRIMTISIK